MNIEEYFLTLRTGDYQNDNFKSFLKKVGFSFKIPSIHIAGSNGKGSTANFIASIYRATGKKVGLFTSPYLYKHNELTRVNDELISDSFYEEIINTYSKYIKKFDISAFELQTFAAFKYFESQNCDLCVIECGMGGEYDATNIFTPIVSVITSISLEHTSYLGRTISEIALHKAGIIRNNVPCVIGQLDKDAVDTIYDVASSLDSQIHKTVDASHERLADEGYIFDYSTYRGIKIKSRAIYSVSDACIALEVIDLLKDKYPVSDAELHDGFYSVDMECRMSIVRQNPLVIIDGAHNPEGMVNFSKSLQNLNISAPIHTVFSCFTDKNLQAMLSTIGEISDELVLTTFPNPRARKVEDYFLFGEDYKFEEDAIKIVEDMITSNPDDVIVVTGSLAFAAYIKNAFNEGRLK